MQDFIQKGLTVPRLDFKRTRSSFLVILEGISGFFCESASSL